MNINRKIGIAVAAMILLPLNISSSPATAGIFRPKCTENTRGLGIVNATSSRNQVLLSWQVPNERPVQIARVCYKKSWALSGKCQDDDRIVTVNYGVPVLSGDILIPNLSSNECYKFAVYGQNVQEQGKGRLIGEQKIFTKK